MSDLCTTVVAAFEAAQNLTQYRAAKRRMRALETDADLNRAIDAAIDSRNRIEGRVYRQGGEWFVDFRRRGLTVDMAGPCDDEADAVNVARRGADVVTGGAR